MSLYLVSYGIWRFIIEYFRADYRGNLIPGLSPSQFWSIIMVLLGVAIFFIYHKFDSRFTKEEVTESPKVESKTEQN